MSGRIVPMPAPRPATPPIRAVFFDLDDTLCDARSAFVQASASAFRSLVARHPHLTEAQVVGEWRALHVTLFADLTAGRRTITEVRLLRFRVLLGALGVPDEPLADELDLLLGRTQLDLLKPFEGVPAVLDGLRGRGLHVGIVTNGAGDAHPDSQRSKAEHLGLLARVDSFFVSDEIGHRKPDARVPARAGGGGLRRRPARGAVRGRFAGERCGGRERGGDGERPAAARKRRRGRARRGGRDRHRGGRTAAPTRNLVPDRSG